MSTVHVWQPIVRRSAKCYPAFIKSWWARQVLQSCRSPLRAPACAYRAFSSTRTRRDGGLVTEHSTRDEVLEKCLRDLDHKSLAFGITPAILPIAPVLSPLHTLETPEDVARQAREEFGDVLPAGLLSEEELRCYERFYGPAEIVEAPPPEEMEGGSQEGTSQPGTTVLRQSDDGSLEEIDIKDEEHMSEEEEMEAELAEYDEVLNSAEMQRLRKSKKGRFFALASKKELDGKFLYAEMTRADEKAMTTADEAWQEMDDAEQSMYLDDIRYLKLEQYLRDHSRNDDADELLQCLFIHFEANAMRETEMQAVASIEQQPELSDEVDEDVEQGADDEEEDSTLRAHPLTLENRFTTFPSTVELPKDNLVAPVASLISGTPNTHLVEAAERIFGGRGLPYSTANPQFAQNLPQKPIPLDPSQDTMSEIEADTYFAAIVPGVYASIMGVLVETRKRLGGDWLRGLMQKEGGPRILDAGGAGAGVVAFREVMRAEWEKLMDDSNDADAARGVAVPTGQEGGEMAKPPRGKATVLTASSALRHRASRLLEETAFVPRLPDYLHASDLNAQKQGKFDIIFAPHTLWSLKENHLRKAQVANLWSLLNSNGGVLIIIEKGVPRGFEVLAGARQFLLDQRIASPGNEKVSEELHAPAAQQNPSGRRTKEQGMIIAPCTNHSACPMYTRPGVSSGRADFCHFQQRYFRPPFLQRLLHARNKNHEDVRFSYLSVMRGRDLRAEQDIVQGHLATTRAFQGYESTGPSSTATTVPSSNEHRFDPTAPVLQPTESDPTTSSSPEPHSLSLPRMILTPLKRTGHVLVDVCTPSATLERWIVSRSFSRQAFRDARKSTWGDLWALGAKTRTAKNVRLGRDSLRVSGKSMSEAAGVDLRSVRMSGKAKKRLVEQVGRKKRRNGGTDVYEVPVGDDGVQMQQAEKGGRDVAMKLVGAGRMRRGKKISGIRDKRDKTGSGWGRRKKAMDE